jgi:uncharacterized membrane protein
MGICPIPERFEDCSSNENDMPVLISAFVLGVVCGLRSMVGLAAASWAANRQQIPIEGTWLSFLGFRFAPYITSVFAVGEIFNDNLPKTPSRLVLRSSPVVW